MLGLGPDVNPPFEMDNRSKRSVVLDLGTPEGRETALEFLCDADVFVTNIRPAAPQRLGLNFQAVAARNPALVYGIVTGYGLEGRRRPARLRRRGVLGPAGIADLLTRPGDTPPFQRGGMGDHSSGMTLAAAICAALVSRNRTGAGQLVTTSLYPPGRLHRQLRPEHRADERPVDRDRPARDDEQPVHEQLRDRRRPALLDRGTGGHAALARCAARSDARSG